MTETHKDESISCFSYEVTMLVHVFAKNREEADIRLDSEGGFIGKRDVTLKDFVTLYGGEEESD